MRRNNNLLVIVLVMLIALPQVVFAWGNQTSSVMPVAGGGVSSGSAGSYVSSGKFAGTKVSWQGINATNSTDGVSFENGGVLAMHQGAGLGGTDKVTYSWAGGLYTGNANNPLVIQGADSVKIGSDLVWQSVKQGSYFTLGTQDNMGKIEISGSSDGVTIKQASTGALELRLDDQKGTRMSLDSKDATVTSLTKRNGNMANVGIKYADSTGRTNSYVDIGKTTNTQETYVTFNNPYGGPGITFTDSGAYIHDMGNNMDGKYGYLEISKESKEWQFNSEHLSALRNGNTHSVTFNTDGSLDIAYIDRFSAYDTINFAAKDLLTMHIPSDLGDLEIHH